MPAPDPASNLHPMRPTDLLRAEHRQIEEQLESLSAALHQLARRGPDPDVLDRIESVGRYIDQEMETHHRKEEEGLFPLLRDHLEAEELNLDGRIADHEDLRIMSGRFKQALDDCRRQRPGPAGRFSAQMLKGYGLYIVHLVKEHLLKEDQILFLVADEYLGEEEERRALRHFREIEAARG